MTQVHDEGALSFLHQRQEQAATFLAQNLDEYGMQVPVLAHCMEQFIRAVQALPVPEDVACEAGCSYCCHTRVSTSPAEVFIIAEQLRNNLSPKIFEEVALRVSAVVKRGDTTRLEWWLENSVSCPFLGGSTGNLCTIYSFRPFTCRSHHSISAVDCREGYDKQCAVDIPCYPVLRRGIDVYSAVFISVMRERGLAAYEVGFIAALSIALSNSTVANRWFAGEDVFCGAEI